MKRLFIFIALLASLVIINACSDYSNSVEPIIN